MPKLNFFWLSGDRFLCVERKKHIIQELKLKSSWNVKNIEEMESADDFCQTLRCSSLFDQSKEIYVYVGDIPEPKKTIKQIESVCADKYFILITDKYDKRSVLYKAFGDYIEDYEIVVENGIPNSKIKDKFTKILKQLSEWTGSDDIFDLVYAHCNYDYGQTVNELKKIILFSKTVKQDQVKDLLCDKELPEIGELTEALKKLDKKNALKIIYEMLELENIDDFFMLVSSAVLELYTFLSYCAMAKDAGNQSQQDIANYIAQCYSKSGLPQTPERIYNRLYFFTDCVKNLQSQKIYTSLKVIENSIRDCLLKKFPLHFILPNMINQIC